MLVQPGAPLVPLVRELQAAGGSPGQAALGGQGGKGAGHHRPLALGLSVLSAPVRGWSAWVATACACLPLAVLADCQAGPSWVATLRHISADAVWRDWHVTRVMQDEKVSQREQALLLLYRWLPKTSELDPQATRELVVPVRVASMHACMHACTQMGLETGLRSGGTDASSSGMHLRHHVGRPLVRGVGVGGWGACWGAIISQAGATADELRARIAEAVGYRHQQQLPAAAVGLCRHWPRDAVVVRRTLPAATGRRKPQCIHWRIWCVPRTRQL